MGWGAQRAARVARRWPLALVGLVLAGVGGAGAGGALAAGASSAGRVRMGPPPPLASAAAVGTLPASQPMHVTVVLRPRDPAGLTAYARAVSTPGSSRYRVYLTPGQFAARFGATPAQVQAVQRSLRSHGLIAGSPAANRLAIPVAGTAAVIERAFSVSFRRLALRGGRRAVVASAAPALDAAIAPDVQAVIGLSSVSTPRPLMVRALSRPRVGRAALRARVAALRVQRAALHRAGDGPAPCAAASAAASSEGAYTADQIASAYAFDQLYAAGAQGQGETIALYELESYDPADIRAYQACYGTDATVGNVAVDGGAGTGPGSGEAALDLEQAIGLAPKATFLVYEGPNSGSDAPGSGPYDTLAAIVSQDRARVVSMSWGQCEQLQGSSVLSAENTLFEEAAVQGQSVVSATGDEGSEDCNQATPGVTANQLAVDDPGSQRFVTGVGGTTLLSPGPPPSETVWNRPGATSGPLSGQGGAGGGGISRAWAMPGYQAGAARSLNVIGAYSSGSPCASSGGYCRQVPDVSADADPAHGYVFYWNGSGEVFGMPQGWQAVGGTSAAAPLWAALIADADSAPACRGSAIGFANPALYTAAGAGYGGYFNDVLTGENDFTGANHGLYPAGPGYDMASGLGSPRAGALAAALCADSLRVQSPGPQFSTVGQHVSLAIATSALPGSRLRFYASRLPPGLAVDGSTGRITGRPERIGDWLVGVAALGQDLSLRGAFFLWRVGGAPRVTAVRLSGVGARRPRLTFTVVAGRNALPLAALSIRVSGGLRFAAARVTVTPSGGRRIPAYARVLDGRLRVVLAGSAERIRITLAAGALLGTPRLVADVRGRHPPKVTITVLATDAWGHGVAARARVTPLG
jgi:subtilase family serine protease